VTTEPTVPLTRRQLRELEANGRFPAPSPVVAPIQAPPAAPANIAAPTNTAAPAGDAAPEQNESTHTAPVEVGFFAALPLAFEASVTELHVESIAGDEPSAAEPTHIEPSFEDDSVSPAPEADPFIDELFPEDSEPTAVAPEAIPVVAEPSREKRRFGRSRTERIKKADRRPLAKNRGVKMAKSTRPAKALKRARAEKRAVAPTWLSMGAMLFASALFVGTTVPANAFISVTATEQPSLSNSTSEAKLPTKVDGSAMPSQKVEVPADVSVAAVARDVFTVTAPAEVFKAKYGSKSYSFTPTSGGIRWPFPSVSPISSGFGGRVAPCRGCSSNHNGVDFTPGMGTPIYAIADGVVLESKLGGGFGQHVILGHMVDGEPVESVYAHMIAGSSPLRDGQEVKVGDLVGLVGSTGASTGAHLHLEIKPNGKAVDPFAWLTNHARD
jgi:murein DD-endopeptidase MepM/ murein hydrolase activator NlpD